MSSEIVDWRNGIGKRMRPDGSFVYVARWNDRDGKKRTETMPDGMPFKMVKAARLERVREAQGGLYQGAMTMSRFVEDVYWPLKEQQQMRPRSLYYYKSQWKNHLEPFFGKLPIRDVKTSHLQRWVIQARMHPLTMRRTLTILNQIIKTAVVLDLSRPVDTSSLSLPPISAFQARFLTQQEVGTLAGAVGGFYEPDVVFLAYTGLRLGEYRALTSDDIDLTRRRVRVNKSLDPWGNLLPTKTRSGERVIDLFDPAVRAVEAKHRLKDEEGIGDCPIMFPSKTGRPMSRDRFVRAHWKPALERLGWANVRIHDLRHTCASLLIMHGATPHYVSQHLGHATPSFTMDRYTHLFDEQRESQTREINAAFKAGQ